VALVIFFLVLTSQGLPKWLTRRTHRANAKNPPGDADEATLSFYEREPQAYYCSKVETTFPPSQRFDAERADQLGLYSGSPDERCET
jgi:hypothetical protein